jgi:hypothetical protein
MSAGPSKREVKLRYAPRFTSRLPTDISSLRHGFIVIASSVSNSSCRRKKEMQVLCKLVTVALLCLCTLLANAPANAAPRAPRTLLIDACGQMRDNALRIWPDQMIVSIHQNHDERSIFCFVAGTDHNMKETFAVRPPAGTGSSDLGREALMAACKQMQGNPNNVFGGRRVYFTEDPDIKVVYCLVRKPDPTAMLEVGVTDPRFVDTVELLFMSYYGEPLDNDM